MTSFVDIKYSFAAENEDTNLASGRELISFRPSVNPRVDALVANISLLDQKQIPFLPVVVKALAASVHYLTH